jgi:hypothetical protein
MKPCLIVLTVVFTLGLITGCAYFQKKDEPPPLPPIEETKPPLKLKAQYFNSFPWDELPAPQKDGNDPDTWTYTFKEGDSMESVAEKQMGSSAMADRLASYNELASPSSVSPGDKIVIPYPIIGMSSQIMIKSKGVREFDPPKPFPPDFKAGDQYKLKFTANVNGHCYIFRKGIKEVIFLYPSRAKTSSRARKQKPLMRETGKMRAHEPIEIPMGNKGFDYDPKKAGDMLLVFLSLREIPALEDLKEKSKISFQELEDVMRRVKEGEILDEPPYHLLRISDPSEVFGFTLNIDG